MDTSLTSPLIGAPAGLLPEVFLGVGLALAGNVLYCTAGPPVTPPVSPPVSPSAAARLLRAGGLAELVHRSLLEDR
jgi:hypothetical protein